MRVLSIKDLSTKGIRYSRSQLYRKIAAGTFVRPIRLGANRIAFVEDEVDAWLRSLMSKRNVLPTDGEGS